MVGEVEMLTKLSEIIELSDFLKNWDGKKSEKLITSNQKIMDYINEGKDSLLNVVCMKQIKKYDPEAFEKAFELGFIINYQQMNFKFINNDDKRKTCLIEHVNGKAIGAAVLLRTNITEIQISNNDARKVLWGILKD